MPADHYSDEELMKRALDLARRGEGRVSPNPMVGAVIVRNGRIVGEGYHLFNRKDHAEIVALRKAGELARDADLYINLEPCTHSGRTPPCVDKVVAAGIRRAFIAQADPNPLVSGRGIARLKKQGIRVQVGLLAESAARLNEVFFHFVAHRLPFVTLKLAQTLDGKIAARSGQSKWITGERARQVVHRMRYRSDAILAGVGTILVDDPSLDVRWRRSSGITKVILDSRLRTPSDARIFQSGDPVLIFHSSSGRSRHYPGPIELISVPEDSDGLSWEAICRCLGERQLTSVVIEGGSHIAASALRAQVVQKIAFFYGPKIIGSSGLPSVADLGFDSLDESILVREIKLRRLGQDFFIEAYVDGESKAESR